MKDIIVFWTNKRRVLTESARRINKDPFHTNSDSLRWTHKSSTYTDTKETMMLLKMKKWKKILSPVLGEFNGSEPFKRT